MKSFIVYLLLLLPLPTCLQAQSVQNLLTDVSTAIQQNNWEKVGKVFKSAVETDVTQAERFYLDSISPTCPYLAKLVLILGAHHKENRNYDKAYNYYAKVSELIPNDLQYLSVCGELLVVREKEEEALHVYKQILTKDANFLSANIFLGNYYFFQADVKIRKLERTFKRIPNPTRMQHASYLNQVEKIIQTEYAQAKSHLEKVQKQFPSAEVSKTLKRIQEVEFEISN